MDSRLNKYYDENKEVINTRYNRHEELYKEISKNDIGEFEVKSNSTVLGENNNQIDVEKIKKILDTKYNEVPKRKSIRIEEEEEKEEDVNIPTKEYDINVVLEKAKEQKTDNYEEERLKKLRNTNYDILNKLKVEENSTDKDENIEEENLKNLINKISVNENKEKSSSVKDSLDILEELRGSDDTEILKGLKEDKEEIENKKEIEEQDDKKKLMDSFYSSSININKKDFEDIEDFTKEVEENNTFIKVIIGIIIVVFLIGVVLLIKTLYFS